MPRATCPLLDPFGVNYDKSKSTVRVLNLSRGEFAIELLTALGPRAYTARMLPAPTHLEGDDEGLTWLGEHLMALVTLAHRRDSEFTQARFSPGPQKGPAEYDGALQGKSRQNSDWDLRSPVPAEEASLSGDCDRKLSSTSYGDEIARLMRRMHDILSSDGPVRIVVTTD